MKQLILLLMGLIVAVFANAQTDSADVFKWPAVSRETDTSLIKLFPNPAKDNVFVTIKDWDNKFRYTFVLMNNRGNRVKSLVLLQPQQLIPLRQSYGKGMLWVEVYKEKLLIGKERLFVADKY
jgi:hypothetical protein